MVGPASVPAHVARRSRLDGEGRIAHIARASRGQPQQPWCGIASNVLPAARGASQRGSAARKTLVFLAVALSLARGVDRRQKTRCANLRNIL